MGKGIVKLGEGNWAVKDGNLLAAKETNGRFKNAEFTVARGTDATYVGRDGLIKRFSSGLANEVDNGNFELGDNGDWTLPSGWSISNNQLVGNDPTGFATVDDVFYANKSYRLDIDVAEVDSGDFTIIPNATDSNSNSTTAIGSTGLHTFYFHIGTISLATLYVTFSGDFVGKINSITVRDIENFDDRPRIDFTDNTDGHLLLEPQSTNLITYSEDFSDNSWSGNLGAATLTSNVAPDGTTNSVFNYVGSNSNLFTQTQASGVEYTISFFVKSNNQGKDNFQLRLGSSSMRSQVFTATSEWVRYSYTNTPASSIFSITSEGANDVDILIWGAQLEALPYATSYIPTSGSTATRDGETCKDAGEAADFSSEGVLYAEIAALANSGTWREINLDDGSTNNAVEIRYKPTANQFQFVVRNGGTAVVSPTVTISNPTEFMKVAFSYKTDDCKMYINGVEVATDTSGTMPSGLNHLSFDWGGTNPFSGKCKAIRVYKEALSDSELVTLTS